MLLPRIPRKWQGPWKSQVEIPCKFAKNLCVKHGDVCRTIGETREFFNMANNTFASWAILQGAFFNTKKILYSFTAVTKKLVKKRFPTLGAQKIGSQTKKTNTTRLRPKSATQRGAEKRETVSVLEWLILGAEQSGGVLWGIFWSS